MDAIRSFLQKYRMFLLSWLSAALALLSSGLTMYLWTGITPYEKDTIVLYLILGAILGICGQCFINWALPKLPKHTKEQ